MRKLVLLAILAIVFCSCEFGTWGKNTTVEETWGSKPQTQVVSAKYADTIQIDYSQNKELLEILCLLPDNAMASWDWKAKERRDWVNEIKENGFIVDTTEQVLNIKKLKPHYFDYQIVDGTWKMAVYKLNNHDRLVFTDDITQGNDIHVFRFEGKQLESADEYLRALLNDILLLDAVDKCNEYLQGDSAQYEYDFSIENKLTVSMPDYTEASHGECFQGNQLTFEMKNGHFELIESDWVDLKAAD